MTSEFKFDVEDQLLAYCREIVQEMMSEFNISYEEALGRINNHWGGQDFNYPDTIYNQTTEYWAKRIYYKDHCKWWVKDSKLEPKPYP
jgi:hypothetical protein